MIVQPVVWLVGTKKFQAIAAAAAATGQLSVRATQLYEPYGQVRYQQGTLPTDRGYTGQRADALTGLDYYNSRYYDPVAGQFTSADTTLAGGLNEYAYVGDNPETRTDPSGHYASACDTALCGFGGENFTPGSGLGGSNSRTGGTGGSSGNSPVNNTLATLEQAIALATGRRSVKKTIQLGQNQSLTLYFDGVGLSVTFADAKPGIQAITINVTDTPEVGMWSDIMTMMVFGGGSHIINLGTGLGTPAVAVDRIVNQLQQATGGVVGIQTNLNPLLQIAIKGPTKVAEFRISPDGTLPGGTKGGPEFRIGIGSGKNVPYLTFGSSKSSDSNATHFWLGGAGVRSRFSASNGLYHAEPVLPEQLPKSANLSMTPVRRPERAKGVTNVT